MPTSDPVPDEDIREAFGRLYHHQHEVNGNAGHHGHNHGHYHSQQPKLPVHKNPLNSALVPGKLGLGQESPSLPQSQPPSESPKSQFYLQSASMPTMQVPLQSQTSKSMDMLNGTKTEVMIQEFNIQGRGNRHYIVNPQNFGNSGNSGGFEESQDFGNFEVEPCHIRILEYDQDERNFNCERQKPDICKDEELLEEAVVVKCPPEDKNDECLPNEESLTDQKRGTVWCNPLEFMDKGRRKYKVTPYLSPWRVQAGFFAKIILIKAIQLVVINLWIFLVWKLLDLFDFVTDYHDWFYLPLGVFFILLFGIRFTAKKRANWHPWFSIILIFLLTMLVAYGLAVVTHKYEAYCIPMATGILLATFVTLPFVPYFTRKPIIHKSLTSLGALLVLLYSVVFLLVTVYAEFVSDVKHFVGYVWFPGMLIAQLVLWVTIYEIQRIVMGCAFNVTERRYIFAALYI